MFDKFINRYMINGEIVAVTALHIGGTEDFHPNVSTNPFFRNAQGLPIIPGSSLKGVLRSFAQQLLSGYDMGNNSGGIWTCSEDNPCIDENEIKKLLQRKDSDAEKEIGEYLFGKKGIYGTADDKHGRLCTVCRLFGSRYSGAKFYIRDAKVIEDSFIGEFEIRSGVAIDRNLGVNSGNSKFEVEVVPEGTRFEFCAILENVDEVEWEFVQVLLRAVNLGLVSVGGMKSRGLGSVRLENLKYQKIDADNIKSYLTGESIPQIDIC